MRFFETKKAFTLMEVNLAIFIMAVGLLAMVALYPLAYRESRQSQDDVKAAAVADCVLNTLTATLSSRNITWNDWEQGIKGAILQKGWLDYCDKTQNSYAPKRLEQINSTALSKVFNKLISINKDGSKPPWPQQLQNNDLGCAIVVQWGQIPVFNGTTMRMEDDRSRVAISLRTTRRAGDLFAQPIFYTEVHFQGDQKELEE